MSDKFNKFKLTIKKIIQFLQDKGDLKQGMGKAIEDLVEKQANQEDALNELHNYISKVNNLGVQWAQFMTELQNSRDDFDKEIYRDWRVLVAKNRAAKNAKTHSISTQGQSSYTTTNPVTQISVQQPATSVNWAPLVDNAVVDASVINDIKDGPASKLTPANQQIAINDAVKMMCNGLSGIANNQKFQYLVDAGFNNRLWHAFVGMVSLIPGVKQKVIAAFPHCQMIASYNKLWPECHKELQESQKKNEESMKQQAELLVKLKEAKKP